MKKTTEEKVKVTRSTRYMKSLELIDKEKAYPIEEAIELAKQTANTKFKGSVEIHVRPWN